MNSNKSELAPFQPGQKVTTGFYPIEANYLRTVTRCYPSTSCESGWLVDSKNQAGKKLLALDSHWYTPTDNDNETDKPEEE